MTDSPRRILLLHTGGTLGMVGEPLKPADFLADVLDAVPEVSRIAELEPQVICNLDSSDIGPEQWIALAEAIEGARDRVEGVVIIHGSDTMAYTASALAFCLEGLDMPVIMTGAQRPLGAVRTDARRNLADAIELATCDIPEVGICFDGLLLRGCRATKSDARSYRAFDSPGVEPLARLGVDVELGAHIRRPTVSFKVDARFDRHVLVIHVTPGLSPGILEAAMNADDRLGGVVLLSFGVGTVPTKHQAIAPVVRELVDRGVDVLVTTQAGGQVDMSLYQNGIPLLEAGAISGGRMRVEAAVTKMMHALAIHDDRKARRRYLEWNVAGEL